MGGADLRKAYAACRAEVTAKARSFRWAIRLLPRRARDPVSALYAFARRLDDAVDEPGPLAERRARLARIEADWRAGASEDPVLVAFADCVRRFNVRAGDVDGLFAGVAQDLDVSRYGTLAELEAYCDRVAATVGRIALDIFGFGSAGETARREATDLGIGMQLANILRDVAEDAARRRVYLPEELLARHASALSAMKELAAESRRRLAAAERLSPFLPRDVRFFPEALAGAYGAVLDAVERGGASSSPSSPRLARRAARATLSRWLRHRLLP